MIPSQRLLQLRRRQVDRLQRQNQQLKVETDRLRAALLALHDLNTGRQYRADIDAVILDALSRETKLKC